MTLSSRLRKFARRFGLIVCLLSLAIWGLSEIWIIGYGGNFKNFGVSRGAFTIRWVPRRYLQTGLPRPPAVGWVSYWAGKYRSTPRMWWPHIFRSGYPTKTGKLIVVIDGIHIPIWTFAAAGASVYLIARLTVRRYPPGHCRQCGYNLTGNVSGTCPECGKTAVAKEQTT